MMDWDMQWLLRINREWTHPLLDWLMPAVSSIHAWLPLLALAGLWLAWRAGPKGRQFLLCMTVAICLGDGLVSNGLKYAVGRIRPQDATAEVTVRNLGKGWPEFVRLFKPPVQRFGQPKPAHQGKSFPSSHTVNLFAAAMVIAHFHRGWGAVAFALASLIGYSRIYVGAHWPSDVIPSIGIGLLVGAAAVWIVRRGLARWASRRP
jgi:undecaprenyl-diphosphatase